MTDEEREQVVELLRCAADFGLRGEAAPLTRAVHAVDAPPSMSQWLDDAVSSVEQTPFDGPADMWTALGADCLEAAQRIEDGEWP